MEKHLVKKLKVWGAVALELLFPKICISCKREGAHLCEDCCSCISLARSRSPLARSSGIAGLWCAASFEEPLVRRAVHSFKYQPFLKDLAEPFAFLIVAHLRLLDKQPSFLKDPRALLIPLPLFRRRLRWRGYNQSEEFAKELSRMLGIPLLKDALVKTRDTPLQTELAGREREENLKGAFSLLGENRIKNKTVILVDDVVTTGTTMAEAARLLKQGGASKVFGLAFARG